MMLYLCSFFSLYFDIPVVSYWVKKKLDKQTNKHAYCNKYHGIIDYYFLPISVPNFTSVANFCGELLGNTQKMK